MMPEPAVGVCCRYASSLLPFFRYSTCCDAAITAALLVETALLRILNRARQWHLCANVWQRDAASEAQQPAQVGKLRVASL